MMKNLFTILIACILISTNAFSQNKKAANGAYKTALGLRVDFGYGDEGVGFNVKHFFTGHNAVDASLLFYGNDVVGLGAEYQYNAAIPNAGGLQYYLGIGPQFVFGGGDFGFAIRPVAGLDYKIPTIPIDVAFDWRPAFVVAPETDFTASRFGLSLRYAF